MFILTPVEGGALFVTQLVHPWQFNSIDVLMFSCCISSPFSFAYMWHHSSNLKANHHRSCYFCSIRVHWPKSDRQPIINSNQWSIGKVAAALTAGPSLLPLGSPCWVSTGFWQEAPRVCWQCVWLPGCGCFQPMAADLAAWSALSAGHTAKSTADIMVFIIM